MKHYCLKPKAKEYVLGLLKGIPYVSFGSALALGFIALPLALIGVNDPLTETFKYLGILSWTALLSMITISIKRWLQSNIIEC